MFAILGISVLRSLSKKTRLDPEFVETMRDLSTMDKQIDSTAGEMVEQVTDLIEPGPIDNSQSK